MSNINRHNYEAYFLDFVEGNLSEEEKAALMLFLEQNPDLKEELQAFEAFNLESGSDVVMDKTGFYQELPGKIDETNCEEHFIAYHEGDLDNTQQQQVLQFLQAHPELQELFDAFGQVQLKAPSIMNTAAVQPQALEQQSITSENCEEFFVAWAEGDLSAEGRSMVSAFLQDHPELQDRFVSFQRLKLESEAIVYTDKEDLRQEEDRKVIVWWRYGVAAAVAVLLGFLMWTWSGNETIKTQQFATEEEVQPDAPNEQPVERPNLAEQQTPEEEEQPELTPEQEYTPAPNVAQREVPSVQEDTMDAFDNEPMPNMADITPVDTLEQSPKDTTQQLPVDHFDNDNVAVQQDSTPQEDTHQEAVAQSNKNQGGNFLRPGEWLRSKFNERVGGGQAESTARNEEIAYGSTTTEEGRFKFVRRRNEEGTSYLLKVGEFSISGKNRNNAVTNSTP